MYADSYGMNFPSFYGHIWCLIIFPGKFDVQSFADRLWGDIYFDTENRKFTRKQADPEQDRSFVHFILEPLYKLYSQVVSEETDALRKTLDTLSIKLKPVMYQMDVRPLLKAVLDQFFGPSTGLVDMIVNYIPSPIEAAPEKVASTYNGPLSSDIAHAMQRCDASAPVMVHVSKLYHTTDAQSFRAFGRVMSGTLRKGMEVKVLGEGYSPEDEEDMMKATVDDIWIAEARYGETHGLCDGF